ncbi:hypothetical protein EDF64_11133 [Curtobacterium flaccumfaciens]|uniref:Uncharacterized protein n=1 Tax=Curtobacterium flaccumfaciens TaxID=2035 RepID=A0A4R6DEY7_9MICO|nr:hypothetical protein [Curtobacterium flaccumfaciens]TDN42558.1 hypothetical protein EDF64_11133 [Curtobacterium flaccumfaciens]
MDKSTQARCRQRGCVHYGLWHSATDYAHRFRTVHTAIATVTIEKRAEDDPWSVWMTRHGEQPEQVNGPPEPSTETSHPEYMELRAAVLYALRSAEQFNAA